MADEDDITVCQLQPGLRAQAAEIRGTATDRGRSDDLGVAAAAYDIEALQARSLEQIDTHVNIRPVLPHQCQPTREARERETEHITERFGGTQRLRGDGQVFLVRAVKTDDTKSDQ